MIRIYQKSVKTIAFRLCLESIRSYTLRKKAIYNSYTKISKSILRVSPHHGYLYCQKPKHDS